MSVQENKNEIVKMQNELGQSKRLSELSGNERRQVIDKVFTQGVALSALDPQVKQNDLIFGEGFTNINGQSFFFGQALVDGPLDPATAQENTHIKVKLG